MKTRRRTEITIETHEALVIHRRQRTFRGWCAECASETEMVSPEEAAMLVNRSQREIFQGIETAGIHCKENQAGKIFICLASLDRRNFAEEGQ